MDNLFLAGSNDSSYDEESSASDAKCAATLREIVVALGISGVDRDYLLSMPTICRWFYLLGAWIGEPSVRVLLAHAICLHNFGIKLLDDIVDGDTPCSDASLVVVGSLLCEEAYSEMAKASAVEAYFLHATRPFVALWRDQFDLDTIPTGSLQAWRAFAEMRISRQMRFYSGFLSGQSQSGLDPQTTSRVFHAIGEIWTIFDDFRDKEQDRRAPDNRHTNLALLLETGLVEREAIAALLDEQEQIVREVIARRPPALDFTPFLERVLQRCRNYLGLRKAA